MTKRLELLAPAGDMEKLVMAVTYGADAVYLAGTAYGMRAGANNFTAEELPRAIAWAHERGVKVYVTCNTIPTEDEIRALPGFLELLDAAGADAIIVADLGVMNACKKYAPGADIHISTQAGVMNSETARAFYDLGAKRVILAREMSLESIAALRRNIPEDLEIEAFCHGSMCVSFSGRCVLSNYLTGRDANRGQCAQPCRWKYYLVEEKRPGQYFEITEDKGTYILNSRDLRMIEHVPAMLEAGVDSLKIEGRTKSSYYVASVTGAYRHSVDAALEGRPLNRQWIEEVCKVSHRPYSTGFYFGQPGQHTADSLNICDYDVVAVVESCDGDGNAVLCQRNPFSVGDRVELLIPGRDCMTVTVGSMTDEDGNAVEAAVHPRMLVRARLPVPVPEHTFLRKKRERKSD
ncbi:MAG: peptidase U32 family protein [Oscillospiraceae bacterium]|jgi:putative protease